MRAIEIEAWVLRVVERIEADHHHEDTRVELKATWPDDLAKAARQLAGQANAARGEPILWIIGVDQVVGVVGVAPTEIADWFAKIKAQFNSLAPPMQELVVPVKDKIVVALVFETERVPFLVKNPIFGKAGGGPVAWEIPWRENATTRTATREDLVRILSPMLLLPSVELTSGQLEVRSESGENPRLSWRLDLFMYLMPRSDVQLVIPFHRCEGSISIQGGPYIPLKSISMSPNYTVDPSSTLSFAKRSLTIDSTPNEVIVRGPGIVVLASTAETPFSPEDYKDKSAKLTIKLQIVGVDLPVVIIFELTPSAVSKVEDKSFALLGRWILSQP